MVHVMATSHYDTPAEPPPPLFFWGEFLAEEPSQPQGGSGKPQPSFLFLFERELGHEQSRDNELVAVGR